MGWAGAVGGGLAATLLLVPPTPQPASPQSTSTPGVVVVMETSLGRIDIEIDVARAPVTSANFLRYVDDGRYDGGRFHRAVRPGTETNTAVPIQVIQASRSPRAADFAPIPLERTSKTGLKHVNGAVSMARSGPDSATSDFFICIGDQPALDDGGARNRDGQGFAVFGRVITGMDVVRRIQASPVFPGSQVLQPPIPILSARRRPGG